jgi:hypothetical protein
VGSREKDRRARMRKEFVAESGVELDRVEVEDELDKAKVMKVNSR